jgi:hypothetical protein
MADVRHSVRCVAAFEIPDLRRHAGPTFGNIHSCAETKYPVSRNRRETDPGYVVLPEQAILVLQTGDQDYE